MRRRPSISAACTQHLKLFFQLFFASSLRQVLRHIRRALRMFRLALASVATFNATQAQPAIIQSVCKCYKN